MGHRASPAPHAQVEYNSYSQPVGSEPCLLSHYSPVCSVHSGHTGFLCFLTTPKPPLVPGPFSHVVCLEFSSKALIIRSSWLLLVTQVATWVPSVWRALRVPLLPSCSQISYLLLLPMPHIRKSLNDLLLLICCLSSSTRRWVPWTQESCRFWSWLYFQWAGKLWTLSKASILFDGWAWRERRACSVCTVSP